jgi:hypothetical protein
MQKIKKSLNNLLLLLSLFLGGTEKAMETPATKPNTSDKKNNSIESLPVTTAAASSSGTEEESPAPSTAKASSKSDDFDKKTTESSQASAAAANSSGTEEESSAPSTAKTPDQEKASVKSFPIKKEIAAAVSPTARKPQQQQEKKDPFKEYLLRITKEESAAMQPAASESPATQPAQSGKKIVEEPISQSNFFEHLAQTLNTLYRITISPTQAEIVFNDLNLKLLKEGGIESLDHFKELLIKYWNIDGIRSSKECLLINILKTCNKSAISKDVGKGYCYELSIAPKIAFLLNKEPIAFGEKFLGRDFHGKQANLDFDICFDDLIVECKNKNYSTYTDCRKEIEKCRRNSNRKEGSGNLRELFVEHPLCKDIYTFKRGKILAACKGKKYLVVLSQLPKINPEEFICELQDSKIYHIVIPVEEHIQKKSATAAALSPKIAFSQETTAYLKSPTSDLEEYITQIVDIIKESNIKKFTQQTQKKCLSTSKSNADADIRQLLIESSPEELESIKKLFQKNSVDLTPNKKGVLRVLGSHYTPQKNGAEAKVLNEPSDVQRNLVEVFAAAAEDAAVSAASHAHLPLASIEEEEEETLPCCLMC